MAGVPFSFGSLCFPRTHLKPVRIFMDLSALVSLTIIFIGSITKMPIIEAPWDVGGDENVPSSNVGTNENRAGFSFVAPCRHGDLCCSLPARMNRNIQQGSNNLRP